MVLFKPLSQRAAFTSSLSGASEASVLRDLRVHGPDGVGLLETVRQCQVMMSPTRFGEEFYLPLCRFSIDAGNVRQSQEIQLVILLEPLVTRYPSRATGCFCHARSRRAVYDPVRAASVRAQRLHARSGTSVRSSPSWRSGLRCDRLLLQLRAKALWLNYQWRMRSTLANRDVGVLYSKFSVRCGRRVLSNPTHCTPRRSHAWPLRR